MEGLEREVTGVKGRVDEMGSNMRNMESHMETINEFLRELKETTLAREGGNKGKTPVGQEASPSDLPPLREPLEQHLGRTKEIVEEEGTVEDRRVEGDMNGRNQRDLQYRRLELPLFNRDEALDWVSKIERYFTVNRLTEREKLMTAGIGTEGDALHWLQWTEKHLPLFG